MNELHIFSKKIYVLVNTRALEGRYVCNAWKKMRSTIGITGAYTPRIKLGRITPPQHDRTNVRVYKCPVHSLVRCFFVRKHCLTWCQKLFFVTPCFERKKWAPTSAEKTTNMEMMSEIKPRTVFWYLNRYHVDSKRNKIIKNRRRLRMASCQVNCLIRFLQL